MENNQDHLFLIPKRSVYSFGIFVLLCGLIYFVLDFHLESLFKVISYSTDNAMPLTGHLKVVVMRPILVFLHLGGCVGSFMYIFKKRNHLAGTKEDEGLLFDIFVFAIMGVIVGISIGGVLSIFLGLPKGILVGGLLGLMISSFIFTVPNTAPLQHEDGKDSILEENKESVMASPKPE